MAVVGAAVLLEIDELADQPWQPRPASLGGRMKALWGACGRLLGVPICVAPSDRVREMAPE